MKLLHSTLIAAFTLCAVTMTHAQTTTDQPEDLSRYRPGIARAAYPDLGLDEAQTQRIEEVELRFRERHNAQPPVNREQFYQQRDAEYRSILRPDQYDRYLRSHRQQAAEEVPTNVEHPRPTFETPPTADE